LLDSDILDVPAECFVSSGNTELKMTGGVNGALLSKYGPELQYELDEFKINKNIKYVTPGFIYSWNQKIRPYKKVLYCAGVDFFYKSSIDLVVEIMKESIKKAEKWDCKTIVFCALGTGYGNLSEYDFGLAFSVIAGIKCKIEKIYIAHHSAEALKKIESGIYQEKQKLLIFN
jgi:O-acetyl-ADP-ribose deacetylase (regulator of RNase III)